MKPFSNCVYKNITISFLVFICLQGFSQISSSIWMFGNQSGVSFNSGSPVNIPSNIFAGENSCSITDAAGNLLFYTNGYSVWDASLSVMSNGNGLSGDINCAQAATIVPVPLKPNLYYIFTVLNWTTTGTVFGVCYSIVDMSLNGGLGAITLKNIPVNQGARESLTAIKHVNNRDYWVTYHDITNGNFYTHLLDSSGLSNNPTVSNVSSIVYDGNRFGSLRFSPNGCKLAFALGSANISNKTTLEIYDFNAATGAISNPQLLADASIDWGIYSCEFSPNSDLLYVTDFTKTFINQYDLTAGTTAQIIASKTNIAVSNTTTSKSGLQLGPDNKIYVGHPGINYISRIDFPDIVGAGCTYSHNIVSLGGGISSLSFPNLIHTSLTNTNISTQNILGNDTTICPGQGYYININFPGASISWNGGVVNDSILVDTPGVYWVNISPANTCSFIVDTLVVNIPQISVGLGADTTLCAGQTINLNPLVTAPNPHTYLWNNGSSSSTLTASTTGIYWSEVTAQGCSVRDSISVTVLPPISLTPQNDRTICLGDSTWFYYTLPPANYFWSNGTNNDSLLVTNAGTYFVNIIGISGCFVFLDTFNVNTLSFQVNLPNDTQICPKTSVNIIPSITGVVGPFTYDWSTGSSGQTILVSTPGLYWLDVNKNGCIRSDSIQISNFTLPHLNIGPDTTLCSDTIPYLLQSNLTGGYLWNTGDTTRSITGKANKVYILYFTDSNSCLQADTAIINYQKIQLHLGKDITACYGENFLFNVKQPNLVSYLWSNGRTYSNIQVNEPGIYSVLVKDSLGCSASDTIEVVYESCSIYIPSAFSPDGNNGNDLFQVKGENIKDFYLQIYNRWGELVYESDNILGGWDGTFKSTPAPMGVYSYKLQYKHAINFEDYVKHGQVTLLR